MSGPTDEEILKLAEQLNDGVLSIDNLPKDFHDETSDKQQILAAIAKINHITNNIRQHSHDESRNLKQGDIWAHLEIIKKIGQGGIGEVYCAYDPILASNVAVKFLNQRSQLYISEKQFLDEARHMAKVRHPHVLAIHGATVDQGIPGYWSDYLDGQLLSEIITGKNNNTWDLQLKYALHLCQALKAIHNNQLVHGDIKASNVMVQPERGAILLDFGSSSSVTQAGNEQYIQQASPMAMAPEQFAGQAANQSTDIFSLGLVFWQLSANHHPLQGLELEAIKQQTTQLKNIQGPPGPKAWKQLIHSMVEAKPNKRPDIQAVEKAINHVINRPVKKAKQVALISVLLLATGITTISLYSNYKTTQAQIETQAMNALLSDILMTSSPLNKGKDVLLMDVLLDAQNALLANNEISERQKIKSLLQLLQTYRSHSNNSQALELASTLLSRHGLTNSEKLDLLMQKADILNRNRKFSESEALYLQALNINPIDKKDSDVLVLIHIGLIKNYIETAQLNKIPAFILAAKSIWETSNEKQSNLGLIHQIEGNYYEAQKQYSKAFTHYQKAQGNFEAFYGPKNLNVLIAKGNAATVLTFSEETRSQSAQMMESLIAEMTEFLGSAHTSTLIARANLSSIYGQLKQPQKALETIVPFLPDVYQAFGKEGGTTMAFENIVAELYVVSGDHKKANEIFSKIITIQTNTHGENAKPTLSSRLKRVSFLQETNQLDEANLMLNNILNIALAALPENDRLTLDIEESLIWNQYLQGGKNVRVKMQQMVEKKSNLYGHDDPSTLSASNRLTDIKE